MLIENPAEFYALCRQLRDEWDPLSLTEHHLVEDIAVCRWNLGRMEALISRSNLQSAWMHLAFKHPSEFRTEKGTIRLPEFGDRYELSMNRALAGIQRHQASIERSYYRALDALQKLQTSRGKDPTTATYDRHMRPEETNHPPEQIKVAAMGAGTGAAAAVGPAEPGRKPATPARRRFGNAWLHVSGLPEDV